MKARLIESKESGAAEGGKILTVGFDCTECWKHTQIVWHTINEISPDNKITGKCGHCGNYCEVEGVV